MSSGIRTSAEQSAEGTPLWIDLRPDPIYAVLHTAPTDVERDCGVLIVPPFGWEQTRSYRPRRQWATELARAGFTTLRIDLPGTEDSVGSPISAGRVQSWKEAVAASAAWLKSACGVDRVAVVGIGLGGLLSMEALSAGGPIDDLVLWAVPSRGSASLRELRTLAGLVASRFGGDPAAPEDADGVVGLAGYPISAEIASWLAQLDLTALPIADPSRLGALLIERDARGVDQRLRSHLEQLGASVTILPAKDYAVLTSDPQQGAMPTESIAGSIEWLRGRSGGRAPRTEPLDDPIARRSVTFDYGGRAVRETLFEQDGPAGRQFGILCEPADGERIDLGLVMVNTGALRRTSPNRIWPDVARRGAARGLPTARFDLEALGDSDGDGASYASIDDMYTPHLPGLHAALVRGLYEHGFSSQFLLLGICSGAYCAMLTAISDEHVRGGVLINMLAFEFSQRLLDERELRRLKALAAGGLSHLRRRPEFTRDYLRNSVNAIRESRRLFRESRRSTASPSAEESQATVVEGLFNGLRDNDVQALFLFSETEPAYDELERDGRIADVGTWPNITIEQLPTRDHEFRALPMQRLVNARIDRAVDELLARLKLA